MQGFKWWTTAHLPYIQQVLEDLQKYEFHGGPVDREVRRALSWATDFEGESDSQITYVHGCLKRRCEASPCWFLMALDKSKLPSSNGARVVTYFILNMKVVH